MSEIRATTISDETGNGPIALTKQHAAKAWGDYNQSTNAILGSFNVSSITDFATGRFDTVLATHMNSTAYSITASSIGNNSSYANACSDLDAKATDGLRQRNFHNSSHSSLDLTTNSFVFHGDLA